ncbi:MAG: hypothetical protein PXY39_10270 [archaeon]|nr:hypothetical protein [archaeon]
MTPLPVAIAHTVSTFLRLPSRVDLAIAARAVADDCISQIEKVEKAGVNQVLLGAPLGPNPKESVNIVGQKIIPYFRNNDHK